MERRLRISWAVALILVLCMVSPAAGGVSADSSAVIFQRPYGGSGAELAYAIQEIGDGGYIAAGTTGSNDGDVSGNHGGVDAWVVKTDAGGMLLWQRCLGGSGDDTAASIRQTDDGGYVLTGYTTSNDGDVSGNHGSDDLWVVKLDADGDLLWQRCLGGSFRDAGAAIRQTSDGGYVVAGAALSFDGDVRGNNGLSDVWVVKLDGSGSLLWQSCLGGSGIDAGASIQETADGGYIVAGGTFSNNGDVSGNHGGADAWVVKMDGRGRLLWQRCLGGSEDDYAAAVAETADGGYIVTGTTGSSDGDITGNHGSDDLWVVKLDADGDLLWQRCLGGSGDDRGWSICRTTDGGYLVGGWTASADGDATGSHGGADLWMVKLNAAGSLLWQRCCGGSGGDYGYGILQHTDGGYVGAGSTASRDGDVTGKHASSDLWVVKVAVRQVAALPGYADPPTDPDGDGLYEDLNGSGRLDFADVVVYFEQMEWIADNEPVDCFDYNGNGRIDFNDIVVLFGGV
ncbi:T9SS C-terminal target domain-containing protein [Methanoculleus sp. FWC-SCC1]|uniref:T9SS C-terminal target domain-containing protein n=1 Tax=Methanoculleus frigidifontis TaxID=2584085 RepID=A0ABT8MBI5_9EURY|nr:hypothetical protein [Methanoculleus sp. FWC-SCC1]MDN7025301.1 T9SS C-terminal target domain-containing protein [Methanoculleus sp. FWC-SCC1]